MKLAKPKENSGCLMGAFIIITLGLIILALVFGVFNVALNVWAL
jgi:hypothetical protein